MAEQDNEQSPQQANASNVAKFLFLRSLLNGGQPQQQAQQQQPQLGGFGGLGGLFSLFGGQQQQQGAPPSLRGLGQLAQQNFLQGGGNARDVPGRILPSKRAVNPNPAFTAFTRENLSPDNLSRFNRLFDDPRNSVLGGRSFG